MAQARILKLLAPPRACTLAYVTLYSGYIVWSGLYSGLLHRHLYHFCAQLLLQRCCTTKILTRLKHQTEGTSVRESFSSDHPVSTILFTLHARELTKYSY